MTRPFPADAYLAAIIESSDDAIVGKDLNGIVTSWNRAAERLFGYTAEEMIGRSILTIIPPERVGEEDYVLGRIRAGQRVEHFETVRRTRNGRLVEISLTVSPIRDADGRVIGASKIARDITERNRLREARRLAIEREEAARVGILEAENRRVREASRLKSEFVANISHELRTPLNSIIGFAELMADERFGPLPDRYPQFARTILGSAEHLLRLINDILDLAKVDSGRIDLQPETIDLPALVADVVSTAAAIARKRAIEIATDVDPAVREVHLDPTRLTQVLYNYLSNAIKFSHDGGRVDVRVRPEDDDRFRIDVEDRGIGIRPEDLDRLFVDFQQLDSGTAKQHQGTGLGLALTRRIVEAQGGSVGVRSSYGEGTVFTAILPRRTTPGAAVVTPGNRARRP